MWWWTAVSEGFAVPVADARLQLFRLILGVAIVWKAGASAFYGDWSRFEGRTLDRFRLERRLGDRRAMLMAISHRPAIVARLSGGLALTCGIYPKAACVLAVLGFTHELVVERRFNTIYIMLCSILIICAGRPGEGFVPQQGVSAANTWAQAAGVLLVTNMYWNSAYLKLRSPHFRSGLLLAQLRTAAVLTRPRMPKWEFYHPISRRPDLDLAPTAPPRVFTVIAYTVIALELAIPVSLLIPETFWVGVSAGAVLHLAFLAILPIRLLPFTLSTLGAYVLFQPGQLSPL